MSQPTSNKPADKQQTTPAAATSGPPVSAAPSAPAVPTSFDPMAMMAVFASVLQNASGDQKEVERRAEVEKLNAELELGVQERSQRLLDSRYPVQDGMKRFNVLLNDKNGWPQLTVPAYSEREARAKYEEICGINYVEKANDKYVVSLAQ